VTRRILNPLTDFQVGIVDANMHAASTVARHGSVKHDAQIHPLRIAQESGSIPGAWRSRWGATKIVGTETVDRLDTIEHPSRQLGETCNHRYVFPYPLHIRVVIGPKATCTAGRERAFASQLGADALVRATS